MPCLLALMALAVPRLVIAAIWLLSNWFQGVFGSLLWPVLGFFFAPVTLLWYSAVHNWYGGIWQPWHVAVLVVTILIDLSPGAGKRGR